MQMFYFRNFFFSVLKDFSGKTYQKTCRFYSAFPKCNSNWTCPPNFTLWIFFSKIWWPCQFNWHIFRFPPFARKVMKRPTIFMTYFQIFYHDLHFHKNLSSGNLYKKDGGRFKMFTIHNSFPQLWATFALKFMKRPIFFFTYFESTTSVLHLYKIWWSKSFFKKNDTGVNMSIKALLFQQLWTIVWTNIVKNPSTLVTYCSSSFPSLHYHAILWRPHFYNTNDRGFNVANKLLLISKTIFFISCF